MLTICYARENVDKDRYLFDRCAEDALLIVPDQYTLEAEKDLLKSRGRKGLLGMEVLSFSRLGSRILNEAGGRRRMIDRYGRHMLLGRIVRAEKPLAVIGWGALFLLDAEALMLTYTRSIYLTTGIVFILTLALCLFTAPAGRTLARTAVLIVLFLLITYGQELALKQGIFQYACARCFNFDLEANIHIPHTWTEGEVDMKEITANSNETREETVNGLKEIIREYPLIGRGLGATSDARDGADEYFYLDMLARMGIIGLTLYILPVLLALLRAARRRRALKADPETGFIVIGLIGFLIATYFNPWMNAALGIAWYALTIAAVWTLKKEKDGTTECAES